MRWLSRLVARASTRLGDESGVTIIFIAVVLLGLLAMTAFVIDFGRIWQERRELQTGATAAAFAVAEDCARDIVCDDPSAGVTANVYADANSTDGAAAIHAIVLDLTAQTIEVVTATEEPDGSGSMDMFFARIVGFDTITVGAGATVAWGTPRTVSAFPLIISNCEWLHPSPPEDPDDWVGWPGGTKANLPVFDPGAPLTQFDPDTWVVLSFHDTTGVEPCNALPGHDFNGDNSLPGGFGWLETNGDCDTTVSSGSTAPIKTGNAPPNDCNPADFEDMLGNVVMIPYFSDFVGNGSNAVYDVEALGAFVVGGYNLGGPAYRKYLDPLPGVPCGSPTRCVAGWFVQDVDNGGTGGPFGGEDRGVTVIQLIG